MFDFALFAPAIEPASPAASPAEAGGGAGGGMLARMLGLDQIMRLATDPKVINQALGMMAAIADAGATARRNEHKLDLLLEEAGYDVETVNRICAERERERTDRLAGAAGLLVVDASAGTGGPAAASAPLDDGDGKPAAPARRARHHAAGHGA